MRTGEYDFLDVTVEDQEDLEVMAELARPGYPKLKEILDEEVGRSVGKTMVACTLPLAGSPCAGSSLTRLLLQAAVPMVSTLPFVISSRIASTSRKSSRETFGVKSP